MNFYKLLVAIISSYLIHIGVHPLRILIKIILDWLNTKKYSDWVDRKQGFLQFLRAHE